MSDFPVFNMVKGFTIKSNYTLTGKLVMYSSPSNFGLMEIKDNSNNTKQLAILISDGMRVPIELSDS